MIDLFYAFGFQKCCGFFAANAAGAEHSKLCFARRQFRTMGAKPIGKFAEGLGLWVNRTFKRANRHFIIITRVDQHRVRIGNQRIPILGLHISADLMFWVDALDAERNNLFFEAHFHPVKGHFLGMRIFHIQIGATGNITQK